MGISDFLSDELRAKHQAAHLTCYTLVSSVVEGVGVRVALPFPQ